MTNETKMNNFIDSIKQILYNNNLDGIDLDWES
jgi:GH18 family chitinase